MRLFKTAMIPVSAAALLILIMFLLIYIFSFGTINSAQVGQSAIAIRPLLVWRFFSPHIPASLALAVWAHVAAGLIYIPSLFLRGTFI